MAWYCHCSCTIFTAWVCLKVVWAPDFSGKINPMHSHTVYFYVFLTLWVFFDRSDRSLVIIRLVIWLSCQVLGPWSPSSFLWSFGDKRGSVSWYIYIYYSDQMCGYTVIWCLWWSMTSPSKNSMIQLGIVAEKSPDLGKGWLVVLNHCSDKFR